MSLIFVAIWLVAGGSCFNTDGTDERLLPSLNYWELSSELLHRPDLQKELEVSKAQVAAVNQMRGRKEFTALFNEERHKLIENQENVPVLGYALSEFYFKFDNVVHRELVKILSDFQLAELKRIRLKERFTYGYEAFGNDEILDFCDVKFDARAGLKKIFERESKDFAVFQNEQRLNYVSEVLDNLPPQALRLFVHYAGNKYSPSISLENNFPTNSIPFSPRVNSISLLAIIYGNRRAYSSIGLTDEQLKKLSEIDESHTDAMSAFGRNSISTTFQEYKKSKTEIALREMNAVISPSQVITAKRLCTMVDFEQDFATPFTRPEFVAYLALSKVDADLIKSIAMADAEELKSVLQKRNEEILKRLQNSLPAKSRDKMEKLFENIW